MRCGHSAGRSSASDSRTFRRCRPGFAFSGYNYDEMEIPVPRHPEAMTIRADPLVVIRPEGGWDRPGVLDQSASRPGNGSPAE